MNDEPPLELSALDIFPESGVLPAGSAIGSVGESARDSWPAARAAKIRLNTIC